MIMSESKKDAMDCQDVLEEVMGITPEGSCYLRTTAKWAKFLAIVYFVLIALMIIGGISMLAGARSMGVNPSVAAMGNTPFMGFASSTFFVSMGVMYLIMAVVYFFPTLFIYRFATRTLNATAMNSTSELTLALEQQKKAYKYIGILFIVMIVLIIIGLIMALFGAAHGCCAV